jgi:hypothetical protein
MGRGGISMPGSSVNGCLSLLLPPKKIKFSKNKKSPSSIIELRNNVLQGGQCSTSAGCPSPPINYSENVSNSY